MIVQRHSATAGAILMVEPKCAHRVHIWMWFSLWLCLSYGSHSRSSPLVQCQVFGVWFCGDEKPFNASFLVLSLHPRALRVECFLCRALLVWRISAVRMTLFCSAEIGDIESSMKATSSSVMVFMSLVLSDFANMYSLWLTWN